LHGLFWLALWNGLGAPQDYAKAREWFERAAEKGSADAMVNLSSLYADGRDVKQDFVLSIQWAKKAVIAPTANASVNASAKLTLSYSSLFVRDFAGALSASEEAIQLLPKNLAPITNKAHALMFLGRAKEARELYLTYKGQRVAEGAGLWEDEILNDFDKLEKAGVTHPQMAEIRAALAPSSKKK
jgi:TPR repeat protein